MNQIELEEWKKRVNYESVKRSAVCTICGHKKPFRIKEWGGKILAEMDLCSVCGTAGGQGGEEVFEMNSENKGFFCGYEKLTESGKEKFRQFLSYLKKKDESEYCVHCHQYIQPDDGHDRDCPYTLKF